MNASVDVHVVEATESELLHVHEDQEETPESCPHHDRNDPIVPFSFFPTCPGELQDDETRTRNKELLEASKYNVNEEEVDHNDETSLDFEGTMIDTLEAFETAAESAQEYANHFISLQVTNLNRQLIMLQQEQEQRRRSYVKTETRAKGRQESDTNSPKSRKRSLSHSEVLTCEGSVTETARTEELPSSSRRRKVLKTQEEQARQFSLQQRYDSLALQQEHAVQRQQRMIHLLFSFQHLQSSLATEMKTIMAYTSSSTD